MQFTETMILLPGNKSPLRLLGILALASASEPIDKTAGGLRKTHTRENVGQKPTADVPVFMQDEDTGGLQFVDPHRGLQISDADFIPIPVDDPSTSQVEGRLLFNTCLLYTSPSPRD